MTKIGYVRVSKHEQNEALQIDALKEAGCKKWFTDKITGSKAERKGLSEALGYLRPGGHVRGVEIGSSRALIEASDRAAQRTPRAGY
jgi:DNA invertase Pin-like site-specific DNA recombinase